MEDREAGNAGKRGEIDALAQMYFYIFANPTRGAGRQAAARLRRRLQSPQSAEQIEARPGMQRGACGALPSPRIALGWRHQSRPSLVAPGDDQPRRNITRILATKQCRVSLE